MGSSTVDGAARQSADRPQARQLDRAVAMVDDWVASRLVSGVSLAIAWRGELLIEHAAGKESAGRGAPVTPETVYPLASLTKPITAATVMILIERGDLYLDEPIRRWVPEFATATSGADRRRITPRELLCHVSGLPGDDPDLADLYDREAPFADIVDAAAAVPLVEPPGRRVRYSNVGYWLLGGLVEIAARAPFADVVAERVVAPAGLTSATFTPGEGEGVARRYGPNRIINTAYGQRLGIPTGGLFATARDMSLFAGSFVADDARRCGAGGVSGASVALMTTDQTRGAAVSLPMPDRPKDLAAIRPPAGPLPGGIPGVREWDACPWGFGWEVRGDKRDHWTGALTSPGTISHIGQSGCMVWADPGSGLSLAVLANRDLGSGWALGGRPDNAPGAGDSPARFARLSDIVAAFIA